MKWISLAVLLVVSSDAWSSECSISIQQVDFGLYNQIPDTGIHATGGISINCDNGLLYRVFLNTGMNAVNYNSRIMRQFSGNEYIYYNLFLDPSYARVWGDGSSGTDFYGGIGVDNIQTIPVFAYVSNQQHSSGVYTDQILVTIEW